MAKNTVVVRDHFSLAPRMGGVSCPEPTLTDQSQAKDCDVNTIVERFVKTGVMPGTDKQALYGDFSSVPDYQSAVELVIHAEEQFAALDAKVRKRFDNDPANFLDFCGDPKNAQEMADLGLLDKQTLKPFDAPEAGIVKAGGGVNPPADKGAKAPASGRDSGPT